MSTARDDLLTAARDLLEAQGYHATGLSQILQASGAPKGSLYYYFPDGKEGLGAAAIEQAGAALAERVRASLAQGGSAARAVRQLVQRIAEAVEAARYRTGGPLMTIALETAATNERLNLACRAAYARLQAVFAARLEAEGCAPARAAELAAFITASIEGGTMLSRVAHSGDPLRRVAIELERYLKDQL